MGQSAAFHRALGADRVSLGLVIRAHVPRNGGAASPRARRYPIHRKRRRTNPMDPRLCGGHGARSKEPTAMPPRTPHQHLQTAPKQPAAFGQTTDNWEFGGRPPRDDAARRRGIRRLAAMLGITALFFAGVTFTAAAGDHRSPLPQEDAMPAPDASDPEAATPPADTTPTDAAPAAEPAASADPAPAEPAETTDAAAAAEPAASTGPDASDAASTDAAPSEPETADAVYMPRPRAAHESAPVSAR